MSPGLSRLPPSELQAGVMQAPSRIVLRTVPLPPPADTALPFPATVLLARSMLPAPCSMPAPPLSAMVVFVIVSSGAELLMPTPVFPEIVDPVRAAVPTALAMARPSSTLSEIALSASV